jgi:hypothetical protein
VDVRVLFGAWRTTCSAGCSGFQLAVRRAVVQCGGNARGDIVCVKPPRSPRGQTLSLLPQRSGAVDRGRAAAFRPKQ